MVIGGLAEPATRGGVDVGLVAMFCEMERTATAEVADGARAMAAELREGPDARLPGAVMSFAISRPISPIRACSSASSSRMSLKPASGSTVEPFCFGLAAVCSFSFSFSTSHRSTSSIRSSKARTWPTVHFSSFSNRLAIVSKVVGTSRLP